MIFFFAFVMREERTAVDVDSASRLKSCDVMDDRQGDYEVEVLCEEEEEEESKMKIVWCTRVDR